MKNCFGKSVNVKACKILKELLKSHNLDRIMAKKHIHQATIDELWIGLRDVWTDGVTETISEDARRIYAECGFVVSEKGIGWKVS